MPKAATVTSRREGEIITPTKTIPIKRTIVKGTFRLNTEITTTDNERGA